MIFINQKNLWHQVILSLASVIAVLAAIAAVTFAWFTFNTKVNVEPVSSTVSGGSANLLISNNLAGPFDTECTLIFSADPETLWPMSTSNLMNYFQSIAQNRDGISVLYQDVTDQIDTGLIRGTVYLQSEGGANQVYFLSSACQLGSDVQSMAGLRLGMQITTDGQTQTLLFRLDGMLNGTPESQQTTPSANTVISQISDAGNATYVEDPSLEITDYMAVENGEDDMKPQAGTTSLCSIAADEIATVDYWIYLEGCDENCLKSLQSKDIPIQLGFAGVPGEE